MQFVFPIYMGGHNGNNTAGPNEFTDFENFKLEHPENTKTTFATNWPNRPGDGITLRPTLATWSAYFVGNAIL